MTLEVFSIAKVQRVDPLNTLDVLVVAPHPDDAELGMGGSILKLKQEGLRIGVLDLTSGEPTPHGSEEIRQEATQKRLETTQAGITRICISAAQRMHYAITSASLTRSTWAHRSGERLQCE